MRKYRRNKTARAQREAARREREERDRAAAIAGAADATSTIYHVGIDDISPNMLPDSSVDAIITDPPYPKEYLRLFSSLSRLAWRVLKPGGWCVVMTGAVYLPEVIHRLGECLDYRWLHGVATPGGGNARISSVGVFQSYKPILIYQKPPMSKIREWSSDLIKAEANGHDKQLHKWQQNESVFAELVERFTIAGDLVADPFLGSGTTGRASNRQGRHFWGCDIDPECATEKRKLKELLE
jgi:DNA modification methylase